MTAVLVPVVHRGRLGGRKRVDGHRCAATSRWILVLEGLVIGVFAATDVFLFYVLFEAMLIPMYFLIGRYRRSPAAVRGSQVLPVLAARRPAHACGADRALRPVGRPVRRRHLRLRRARRDGHQPRTTQKWLFLGFAIAFAIKAPMWPLHTWLPDAAAEAPPSCLGALLVGVLDKVGTFGMLRLCLPLFPDASQVLRPGRSSSWRWSASSTGRSWPSARPTSSGLIAYTSVSHFGFIVLGIFALTIPGAERAPPSTWSTTASPSPRCSCSSGTWPRAAARAWWPTSAGSRRSPPCLAGLFLVAGLSSLALPGLSSVRLGVPRPGRHLHPSTRGRPSSPPRASSWPPSTS